MNSIRESYLKAFSPTVSIKVEDLIKGGPHKKILKEIYSMIELYHYINYLDEDNGVIYVGKRV